MARDPILLTDKSGKTLYAIAYERGLSSCGFIYLHAMSEAGARLQLRMNGMVQAGLRIVSVAPAIGGWSNDGKTVYL